MENNKVSIIIPVYNRYEMACEAIECALKQDYEDKEVIVGDNHSGDGTFQQLQLRYGDNRNVVLFQNETNIGPVNNWKKCLEKATGEYIKFLWSDDLMDERFVSKAVEALEKHKNSAFVYSSVLRFDDNRKNLTKRNAKQIGNGSEKEDLMCNIGKSGEYAGTVFINGQLGRPINLPVSPGCALFRRKYVKIIDPVPNYAGYDHSKTGAGTDLLIFLEALSGGRSFVFLEDAMNYFRVHAGSITVSDNTIAEGYLTAKLYYMKKYKFDSRVNKMMLLLRVLLSMSGYSFLRLENCRRTICKYYGDTAECPYYGFLIPVAFGIKTLLAVFSDFSGRRKSR